MQRESNDLRRIYYDFIHCILGHETQVRFKVRVEAGAGLRLG